MKYSTEKNHYKEKVRICVLIVMTVILFQASVFVQAADVKYCGDVNQDGVINLKDVTQLRRLLSNEDGNEALDKTNMDVNADGNVNLKDVTYLRRYLAGGWDVELPIISETPETPEKPDESSNEALSKDLQGYDVISTSTSEKKVTSTSFRYGKSTKERDLVCWSIWQGEYERTILLNFEIHGWEDEYAKDGQLLVDLGNYLVDYFSKQTDLHNCRLLIIPSCNPDGLAEGTTGNCQGSCL